jgi:hypothetical protein
MQGATHRSAAWRRFFSSMNARHRWNASFKSGPGRRRRKTLRGRRGDASGARGHRAVREQRKTYERTRSRVLPDNARSRNRASCATTGGGQAATPRRRVLSPTRLQLVRLALQRRSAGVDKPALGVEEPHLVRQLGFQRQQAALGGAMHRGPEVKIQLSTRLATGRDASVGLHSPARLPSGRWRGGPPHPPPAPGPLPRRRLCRRPTPHQGQPHAAP